MSAGHVGDDDRGSIVPLVLGFFLIAIIVVTGAVALGESFVQQRDLQDVCDGAAAAAAASSADLDRSHGAVTGTSLRFASVDPVVAAYLRRDPDRASVHARITLSGDVRRITLRCTQVRPLALGRLFGRGHVRHVVTSSARAAVLG